LQHASGRSARVRKPWLLLCAALLAAHSLAAEQLLHECILRASGESVGLEALDADCPGVAEAVLALDESAFISEGQTQQLRRESLGDLLSLQARYRKQPASGPVLDPAAVGPVLQGLPAVAPPPMKPKSWFELFEAWLKRFVTQNLEQDNWLSRWLKDVNISGRQGTLLMGALSLLVLVMAIAIVTIELRASGIFVRRGARFVTAARVPDEVLGGLGLVDLEATPIANRAPMLLKLLVTALRGAGRLEADQALTHRQLSGRARFDDEQQRRQFGNIAALAERSLYGSEPLEMPELERAMQAGRTLHAQLSQPVAMPSSGTSA
jgi:hypothetical protein